MRKSYKYSKNCAAKLSFEVMLKKFYSNNFLKVENYGEEKFS